MILFVSGETPDELCAYRYLYLPGREQITHMTMKEKKRNLLDVIAAKMYLTKSVQNPPLNEFFEDIIRTY